MCAECACCRESSQDNSKSHSGIKGTTLACFFYTSARESDLLGGNVRLDIKCISGNGKKGE